MEFTKHETKMVERLRKQDRQWRWSRWLVLVMGIFSAAACAIFGYAIHLLIGDSPQGHLDSYTVFFIVLFWTKCFFYFLLSAWSFITVSFKWHGDVNRMLLLRLLDTQRKGA